MSSRRVLVAAVSTVVTLAYGVLLYGFSVFVTGAAAGGEFSTTVLSSAFGGAVLTGALTAVPVGRLADRHGVRGLMATGCVLGGAGMLGFASAQAPWHVLAAWWVLIGPASAMTFYEPAFVALEQWFDRHGRNRAVATLTFLGGLAGPIFVPATSWLVERFSWRPAAAVLGLVLAVGGSGAAAMIPRTPGLGGRRRGDRGHRPSVRALVASPRFVVFTVATCLALAAFEAVMVHRVARFVETGFPLAAVSLWAAVSGVLSFPGRYALPALATRIDPTRLDSVVLAAIAGATALAVRGTAGWELAGFFVLFGLVFGAAIPLRAVIMADWYAGLGFGGLMGVQAAVIGVCRAAAPAAVGVAHDRLGGYALPFLVLAVMLGIAAVCVELSGRLSDPVTVRQAADAARTGRHDADGFFTRRV